MIRYDYEDDGKTMILSAEGEEGNDLNEDVTSFIYDTNPEKLIIGEGVVFPRDCTHFFAGLPHLKSIDMKDADTSKVERIDNIFMDDSLLEEISWGSFPHILSAQELAPATVIDHIFSLDLTGFVNEEGKVPDFSNVFTGFTNLERVTLPENFVGKGDSVWFPPFRKYKVSVDNINDLVFWNSIPSDFTESQRDLCMNMYFAGVGENVIFDVARRLPAESLEEDGPFGVNNIKEDYPVFEKMQDILLDHPEYLLSRNKEDLDYYKELQDDGNPYEFYLNLKTYAEDVGHGTSYYDVSAEDIEAIKSYVEETPDIEELLDKLKTGDLTACYSDFHAKSLKKATVSFLDNSGYIRASVPIKKLDERFMRFIKGVLKDDGTRQTFMEYTREIEEKSSYIKEDSFLSTPYIYAKCSMAGFVPDSHFIKAAARNLYNTSTHSFDLPKDKTLWKLYANNTCWNKTKEDADAFMKIASVLGAVSDDENERHTGENYLQAMTNYIPEDIVLDGYSYAEMYPEKERREINYYSEITVRPGIPYKAKKAEKAIFDILKEDHELVDMVGSEEGLSKFLDKIYPLAELMDYSSVEDIEDENTKKIFEHIVHDLYVSTTPEVMAIDKRDFAGAEGKEKKERFHHLAEKYSSEEDVNMHVLDSKKAHALFSGLRPEYNKDFAKFINNHLRDILYTENAWQMGNKLSVIQKNWDMIQEKKTMNRRRFKDRPAWKMSFKEIDDIMGSVVYEREGRLSDPKYDEVAELCVSYGYGQTMFERVCYLYDNMTSRGASSIPNISGERSGYSYHFLSLDDPAAIFFGQILDCCQQYENAGESCMIHSCESKNGRVFGVFDEQGTMVAGSWTWRNGDTICFDNVEAANNPDIGNIIGCYEEAADKIREAAKENDIINKVTVGKGYSDIPLDGYRKDTVNKYPAEEVDYISDSRTQYILSYSGHDDPDFIEEPVYEEVASPHVNTSLGTSYESTAGDYRSQADIYGYMDHVEDEEEDYEERHSDKVIDDDIDDIEIVERVEKACKDMDLTEEREEDRET